jgi:hypothetical protein
MATTETRSGFRLPWSSETRAPGDAPADQTDAGTSGGRDDQPHATTSEAAAGNPAHEVDAASAAGDPGEETKDTMSDTTATTTRPSGAATKRPTKFLADLTAAMRAAAEAERTEILGRFQADAKAFIELIHERSGTESTAIRKQADDDIASIRDWSKAEIARVREETEHRISGRRGELDREIDAHAGRIEREIEHVKDTVGTYENRMARFFEELVAEEDPTEFAARAESMPEPPTLEDILDTVDYSPADPAPEATAAVEPETTEPEVAGDAETGVEAASSHDEGPVAAAEWPAADELGGGEESGTGDGSADPRVAALGLTPDFDAAEAEARAAAEAADDDGSSVSDEIPTLDEEAVAARLAALVPPPGETNDEPRTTQVSVTGLVSVASIAGFKRQLSRIAGVKSVGVSSGPDGEFLFAVNHDASVELRDAIPTLPGFGARVTGSGEGSLQVTARDPEGDA